MEAMTDLFLYALTGALAGLSAGLLGIGGGLIIVPVLAGLFVYQGMHPSIIMHLALGTSLATIIFTSLSSIRSHQQHQGILWPVFRHITPGILLGATLGGLIAGQLSTSILKPVFAVFELLVALHMISARQVHNHRTLPDTTGLMVTGGFIGSLSALVGIGGGTMTVPFMVWCNINMRHAIATSAAVGLPIAVAGSLSYIISGWSNAYLPELSLGYIHIPSLAGITLCSVLFAPLGAHLAHSLPVPLLKKVFAGFLILMASHLLSST
jgi:uncharacterized protein